MPSDRILQRPIHMLYIIWLLCLILVEFGDLRLFAAYSEQPGSVQVHYFGLLLEDPRTLCQRETIISYT